MKLIVGLGNPGKEYEHTRHNMGFMALDAFAELCKADFDKRKFNGVYTLVKEPSFGDAVILAKPETFMNLSGEFVRPLMDFYKIEAKDLLVVYDDMALPPGKLRLRPSGSSGSHNGMKSIIGALHTETFPRLRIGIGEPPHTGVDWVLGKPSGEDKEAIEKGIEEAAKALRDALQHGFAYAMNHYNK
jgi:peptidyl-tRNA hydrolase, PTH1 family